MSRFVVGVDEADQRLDTFLGNSEAFGRSRSFAQRLITSERVRVNGTIAKASYRLKPGDIIEFEIPPPEPMHAEPEPIPLDVVYEDQDMLVVNKARGMVVHPAAGNRTGTLVNAVLARCPDLAAIGDRVRPGIVHRLDKDTTGILIVAKNEPSLKNLQAQIRAREMKRIYIALVHGLPPDSGTVDAPIARDPRNRKKMAVIANGKPAKSHYKTLERLDEFSVVRVQLETGRTHQIRVHMAHLGFPVAGDPVYGSRRTLSALDGQALHAHKLEFKHPRTGDAISLCASLPEDFRNTLRELNSVFVARLERCADHRVTTNCSA